MTTQRVPRTESSATGDSPRETRGADRAAARRTGPPCSGRQGGLGVRGGVDHPDREDTRARTPSRCSPFRVRLKAAESLARNAPPRPRSREREDWRASSGPRTYSQQEVVNQARHPAVTGNSRLTTPFPSGRILDAKWTRTPVIGPITPSSKTHECRQSPLSDPNRRPLPYHRSRTGTKSLETDQSGLYGSDGRKTAECETGGRKMDGSQTTNAPGFPEPDFGPSRDHRRQPPVGARLARRSRGKRHHSDLDLLVDMADGPSLASRGSSKRTS
jgi:hypothetical protein